MRFKLAYNLLLFLRDNLGKIRYYRQNEPAQKLIWNGVEINILDNELNSFLNLLYQSN